jgi:hypothetical protein
MSESPKLSKVDPTSSKVEPIADESEQEKQREERQESENVLESAGPAAHINVAQTAAMEKAIDGMNEGLVDPNMAAGNSDARPQGEHLQGPQNEALKHDARNVDRALSPLGAEKAEDLWYQRKGFWVAIFGLGATVASLGVSGAQLGFQIFDSIKAKNKQAPPPFSGNLSADQLAALQAIVDAWFEYQDNQLWEFCANFSDANQPLVTTQLLICQDIILLSPAVAWTWTPDEKQSIVMQLTKIYAGADYAGSSIYRGLETIRFNGRSLPRGVAADVAKLAFASQLAFPHKST